MVKPVKQPYRITTQFGVPDSYAKFGRHSGIDYAVPLNRTVYSPVDGTIRYAQKHPTGGNMLMIKDSKGNYHRLMHNNAFLEVNGTVKEGQPVARAGTTGLSTGVHVHHDICKVMWPTSFSQFLDPGVYNDKEGEKMPSEKNVRDWFKKYRGKAPTKNQLNKYTKSEWRVLATDVANAMLSDLKKCKANSETGKVEAFRNKVVDFVKKLKP